MHRRARRLTEAEKRKTKRMGLITRQVSGSKRRRGRRPHHRGGVRDHGDQEGGLRQARPAIAKPGAILATNTSYLDINEIAAVTKRPQDVLGMHFFSPANVMKLCEIVRGEKTAPDVLVTAVAIGQAHRQGAGGGRQLRRLRRQPHAGARGKQAEKLLFEGALPQQVDAVLTKFGMPMGPFAMGDLAGLDIGWRIAQGPRHQVGDRRRALRSGPLRPEDRQGLLQVRSRVARRRSRIRRSRR
jgi:hypothetical protein